MHVVFKTSQIAKELGNLQHNRAIIKRETHPKLVADSFNRYFADMSKNFAESIPSPSISNSPFD